MKPLLTALVPRYSTKDANPSLSHKSVHQIGLTRLPNHWCASSWAITTATLCLFEAEATSGSYRRAVSLIKKEKNSKFINSLFLPEDWFTEVKIKKSKVSRIITGVSWFNKKELATCQSLKDAIVCSHTPKILIALHNQKAK